MINKIITPSNNSNSHNIDFRSSGKEAKTAPAILDTFMDDEGKENYVLEGGKTTLADRYNQIWMPIKSAVQWNAKLKVLTAGLFTNFFS